MWTMNRSRFDMARDKEQRKLTQSLYSKSANGRAKRKLATAARKQKSSGYNVEVLVVNAVPLTKALATWKPLVA